ncbi:astacin-like metalloprotease toxin 1 [Tubulanus polymorphus]|uniref:astacin-like metalloprotease toxin 1 n=1 Tax=Tubulanus polymorphus TaxID=672921 RepID=UPI003DA4C87C
MLRLELILFFVFLQWISAFKAQTDDDIIAKLLHMEKREIVNVHDHILEVNELHSRLQKKGTNSGEEVGDQKVDLMEGDIVRADDPNLDKRSAASNLMKLWRDRVIPYEFSSTIDDHAQKTIITAVNKIASVTCLKFRPMKNGDKNWVQFFQGSGCYSSIGKTYWSNGAR